MQILNGVYVGEENCDIKFDPEGIKLIECDGKCGVSIVDIKLPV